MNKRDLMRGIKRELKNASERSAWSKGVKGYALEMFDTVAEGVAAGWIDPEDVASVRRVESVLLNGAGSWSDASWGGCYECYDARIAARLCSPSELKKTDGGRLDPNASEKWLDTQARALFQAAELFKDAVRTVAATL